ncbi:YheC/YheD family protein [Paenibacillus barcinonensis]|uniref:YheC/D-like protein n=1 Tax=Paenibacillus barcinonensis TaxID=198119 RepID=A0A2V4V8A2_PAEBA|nr:YheC/YheD family protein [Paenibacillus barcinonensis]PYE48805.1 YheC/D-like protein [Paenibacillus barcinonensis]QKS57768.1 YheC/YheD family protein [Paenibacillus barcinonensis]
MSMVFQRDKWLQYRALSSVPLITGQLPETQLLDKETLHRMLLQHSSVVLKPCNGRYGRDIVFIEHLPSGSYRIRNENNTHTIQNTDELLYWLAETYKEREYIIQQRLHLARIQQRPFDLRIMVQRQKDISSPWTVTGTYAKVASRGYLVTNVTNRTIPALKALHLAHIGGRKLLHQVERTSLLAAKALEVHYPELRQVGFDIGIDTKARIWIIEGNYRPDLRPFRRLKDASVYRRILWYQKH